nr:hypothetical protein [Tanacetum cinerariifolium]
STEISRHEVQMETGDTRTNELRNEIEKSNKEKDRVIAQEKILVSTLTEINQRILKVDDMYKTTQQLIDQHKGVLGKARSDYENLKKTVNELQASEIDVVDKLQDMKRMLEELEMKSNDYKKKLEALNTAFSKHMEHYREKLSKYNERVEELTLVTKERDETKKHYDGWRKKRLEEFMAGFNVISLKLKEVYQMITLGGDAELELVDSLDPFSEGVVFSVRPPKKSWKNIGNLSGGECYSDASWITNSKDHTSTTGWIFLLGEGTISWASKKQTCVTDSTMKSEFVALATAGKEAEWLRNLIYEIPLWLKPIYPISMHCDSVATLAKAYSQI